MPKVLQWGKNTIVHEVGSGFPREKRGLRQQTLAVLVTKSVSAASLGRQRMSVVRETKESGAVSSALASLMDLMRASRARLLVGISRGSIGTLPTLGRFSSWLGNAWRKAWKWWGVEAVM